MATPAFQIGRGISLQRTGVGQPLPASRTLSTACPRHQQPVAVSNIVRMPAIALWMLFFRGESKKDKREAEVTASEIATPTSKVEELIPPTVPPSPAQRVESTPLQSVTSERSIISASATSEKPSGLAPTLGESAAEKTSLQVSSSKAAESGAAPSLPVTTPSTIAALDGNEKVIQMASLQIPFVVPARKPNPAVVLVLGGSGRLGREIVRYLVESPDTRRVLAHVGSDESLENETALYKDIIGDKGCANTRKLILFRANLVKGLDSVVEAVRNNGVGKVVFAATGGPTNAYKVENNAVKELLPQLEKVLGAKAMEDRLDLFNFMSEYEVEVAQGAFLSVDDRVMGGISQSALVKGEDGSVYFQGNVSTARGGGFANMRARIGSPPAYTDLSSYDGIAIRCMGDGRTYKLTVRDGVDTRIAYQVSFTTRSGEWQVVRAPFTDFLPTRRGTVLYSDEPGRVYASQLHPGKMFEVGLVVSKIDAAGNLLPDFTSGKFSLCLGSIYAYTNVEPRFLLVSSCAVTRPLWSAERKRRDKAAVQIPIVQLNPGNILQQKVAGENATRRADVPWCIVRPVGLAEETSGKRLRIEQGDMLSGRISRVDAARGIVRALNSPFATYRTMELAAYPELAECVALDPPQRAFRALLPDSVEAPYAALVDGL